MRDFIQLRVLIHMRDHDHDVHFDLNGTILFVIPDSRVRVTTPWIALL